jgi:hypothetical protein
MKFNGNLFIFSLLVLAQIGCNQSPSKQISGSDSLVPPGNADTSQLVSKAVNCYRYVIGRDSILLQLRQNGDSISGVMSFDNYEKDSSHGDIKGYEHKDTIYVLYNFFSEGMQSVMEIALLRSGNGLIRGIGPMVNKGDTVLYKDHSTINYQAGQKLDLVNCNTVQLK